MRAIVALHCILLAVGSPLIAVEPWIQRDIAYAEPKNARLVLDVYMSADAKNAPILFWIHGGGWQRGDKSGVEKKPQVFVDHGYVFVATNYRFVPNVTIDEMAGDCAKAIRWTFDHAKQYGGDPDRIVVAGHSAGAQLAALLCTDHRFLQREGLSPTILKACIPVDGDSYDVPLQVATCDQRRKDLYLWKFGDLESQKNLSAIMHVAKGKPIPPVLILHVAGHPETTLQSERFVKLLRDSGYIAKTYAAADTDHVKLNSRLGEPGDKPTAVVFEFLDEVLKKR